MRRDVPVWVLPGGGIEKRESPEKAALREATEETGLLVEIKRKIAVYYPLNRLASITHFFEGIVIGGDLKVTDETKNVAFFSQDDLPPMIPPPYPDWIKDAWMDSKEPLEKEITSVNYKTLFLSLLSHPILVCRFLLTRIGIHWNSK